MKALWLLGGWILLGLVVIWLTAAVRSGGGPHHDDDHGTEAGATPPLALRAPTPTNDRIRMLEERGVFPCSACHERLLTNPIPRLVLAEPHGEFPIRHGDRIWCLNCHDRDDYDRLVLLDGTRIGFDQTHLLCGQCHGPTYRDWQNGVHGQRTGSWNGQKSVWTCVRCHSPHDPAFPLMRPLEPPRPGYRKD